MFIPFVIFHILIVLSSEPLTIVSLLKESRARIVSLWPVIVSNGLNLGLNDT
jgi:hypothetical protein